MHTTAVLDGDEWVLNGTKMWISNGGLAEFTVVFATTDRQGGHRATIALVVPKDAPGFSYNKIKHKMGQRASLTSELVFEDVRVPKANQLGGLGDGFKIAMKTLDKTRIPVAAGSVGIARRAMEESISTPRTAPRSANPSRSCRPFSSNWPRWLSASTGRLMYQKAAWLVDAGNPTASRAPSPRRTAARWPSTPRTRAFRCTAGTATSASTRSRNCCAT